MPQRDKAWKLFQYPCIGVWYFLKFGIGESPQYQEALKRVKSGETLLDQACCFGQDIRKLVYDGAPAENITGSELERGFIELGYELFQDKEKLKARFTSGDFFAAETAGLREQSFDMVHAASFFHLFSWDGQVEAVSKALRLLKPKPSSMIFGRQICVDEAGSMKHSSAQNGEIYRHDAESFKKLIAEVSAKTEIEVGTEVDVIEKSRPQIGNAWNIMVFSITMK